MIAILFIIILFVICVGGCWLVFTSIGNAIFPNIQPKQTIHNHYYTTENHLHVSKEDLKEITGT